MNGARPTSSASALASGPPLLEVDAADVQIGAVSILRGAELTVRPGQLLAVVGPNGAGKSTLGRVAAGLQPLAAGSVRWSGQLVGDMGARRRALTRAYVPQRPRLPDGVRVREAVLLGRSPHVRMLGRPGPDDARAVDAALERTATAVLADRRLTTLSGGELQRVQLAVALAQGAPLLIADEPTAHLDLGACATVGRLLRGLADEGLGVVLIVHDLALAAAVADLVVVVDRGRTVVCAPPAEALSADRLQDIWGVDARLELSGLGSALHVDWLGSGHLDSPVSTSSRKEVRA